MSLSPELRSKITELETILNSLLWKQHFSIENKASRNWKKHFTDYEALQVFDTHTKELLVAIDTILKAANGMHNDHWRSLYAATVPSNWLMVFLDEREPYVRIFNKEELNPDNYNTWDTDSQTWVEMKGIRVQLNDLIHATKKVLSEIQETYVNEYVDPEETDEIMSPSQTHTTDGPIHHDVSMESLLFRLQTLT